MWFPAEAGKSSNVKMKEQDLSPFGGLAIPSPTQMVLHLVAALLKASITHQFQTFDRGTGLGLDCWWPHLSCC